MGDTRYRGKIVWMLLTSRPELLPIDLKRQGRAEVHIPLFYPQSAEEIAPMFAAMAAKNGISLAVDALTAVNIASDLSGADIESIMLSARRRAAGRGPQRSYSRRPRRRSRGVPPVIAGLGKAVPGTLCRSRMHRRGVPAGRMARAGRRAEDRAKLQQQAAALAELI